MITLFDTYRHLDGTPGQGQVLVRTKTVFRDQRGTVVGDWVAYPLDATGHLQAVIDADLAAADPGPQWLQVLESVDCARGGVWEIGPDILTAGPDVTINLGAVRTVPALGDPPRYQVAPAGPVGPPGPKGDQGDPGPAGAAGPPGPAGSGVVLKGNVGTSAQLPPSGNLPGDMYIVTATGNGWVWDGTQWNDVGPIRGPKGDQGDPGPAGATGPAGPQGIEGPAGPKGDPGQGIQLLGAVATVGDLPATGNTPGDAHLVTDTGDLYVWDGAAWQDSGHVQGPKGDPGPAGAQGPQGPQGPQGEKGDKGDPGSGGVPQDGQDGQVLQWSGGAPDWTDNLATALNRVDWLERLTNDLTDSTVETWTAQAYTADAVVMHSGKLWIARVDTAANEEPGVDGKWRDLTLEALWHNSNHWKPPAPADPADDGKVLTAAAGDAVWAAPFWHGVKADYDAISPHDPNTLYVITPTP